MRAERAGRRGKTVTVAGPFDLVRGEAAELLQTLKRRCGSGGTLKRGSAGDGAHCFDLEIQGDRVERVKTELAAAGYRLK